MILTSAFNFKQKIATFLRRLYFNFIIIIIIIIITINIKDWTL